MCCSRRTEDSCGGRDPHYHHTRTAALEERERELVGVAEQLAQQKVKTLTAQRDQLELQIAQRRSCQDFVEESRRTCSQGEILRMKSPLVKQTEELTGSFKPETLALAEQADLEFLHSLHELKKTCQQFGKVYCHPVYPEKCRASGEGMKVAMRGQAVSLCVEALDREGEAYLRPVDSLRCELVSSDGSSRVRGSGKEKRWEPGTTSPTSLGSLEDISYTF